MGWLPERLGPGSLFVHNPAIGHFTWVAWPPSSTKRRQPLPSLGKRNKPKQDADGSTTLYISPSAPQGRENNWLATVPGRRFFAILRLYAPSQPALDGSWKPGDIGGEFYSIIDNNRHYSH